MNESFKSSMEKAREAFKSGDGVALVSWLANATGSIPKANTDDENYEKVFQTLSKVVTSKGDKK